MELFSVLGHRLSLVILTETGDNPPPRNGLYAIVVTPNVVPAYLFLYSFYIDNSKLVEGSRKADMYGSFDDTNFFSFHHIEEALIYKLLNIKYARTYLDRLWCTIVYVQIIYNLQQFFQNVSLKCYLGNCLTLNIFLLELKTADTRRNCVYFYLDINILFTSPIVQYFDSLSFINTNI